MDEDDWKQVEFLQREAHQLDTAMRALQPPMVSLLIGSLTSRPHWPSHWHSSERPHSY